MSEILDLLQKIRERPGMYLGCPAVNNLYMFLTGYCHARKDAAAGDYEFLAGFGDWVRDRFRVTSSQGWAKIIEFYSASEADGWTLFWELLDEYLARQKSARRKVS
jgi:hypothetical protein